MTVAACSKEKNRKKFNTFGFVEEKPQKSTRIALQYSIVHRRVSEIFINLIFLITPGIMVGFSKSQRH